MGLSTLAVAGYVVFSFLRLKVLIARSQPLLQQSNRFERSYTVGNAPKHSTYCIVMGDSTAVGYGVQTLEQSCVYQVVHGWAATGRITNVQNIAVSGARLNDVVENQLPRLSSWRPDVIIIMVGANDATHGTSLDAYQKQLAALINHLKLNQPQANVLLANTPDMYQAPALPLPLAVLAGWRAHRQNQLLAQMKLPENFYIVDLYNQGKLIYQRDKNLYAPDLFHPSASGYRVWADVFNKRLR